MSFSFQIAPIFLFYFVVFIQEIIKLEKEISVLCKELDELRLMKEINVKKHVFPEIFPCTKK